METNKYTPINGFTKATILEKIETEFKGKGHSNITGCSYRGDNGTKCAVGLFIPDEIYDPKMDKAKDKDDKDLEDATLGNIASAYPEILPYMPLSRHGMRQLQIIHDRSRENETKTALINWINEHVEDAHG